MHDDDPTTTTSLDEAPTDRASSPRYTVARGALGDLVIARDEQLGRTVAIKRLRDAAPSERAVQQFFREAQIQSRLDHPAIPPVFDIGRDVDGRPFIATRHLAGATLADVLAAGGAPLPRVLRALAEACRAIDHAHARGIAHGALAANRIVIGESGEAYVVEWSHAELGDAAASARDVAALAAIAGAVVPALAGDAPTARALAERIEHYQLQYQLMARVAPPAALPPEVAAAIAQEDAAIHRRASRFVAIANFGFLAFVPLLLAGGKQHPVLVGLMCVLVAANAVLLAWAVRGGPIGARWARLAVSVALTALVTRIASPFLLGTPLAAVTCIGLVAATFRETREVVIVGAALAASVVGPWLAEVAGWLSPTMHVDGSTMLVSSPMLSGTYTILGGLVLYTGVIVAVACVLTHGLRIAESSVRVQLHLQAWQLRQLVPG